MKSFDKANFNLIPFVDYLFNILLIFVLIMSLTNISSKKSQNDSAFQQNVLVQVIMDWDGESKTDMDLWAKDPINHIVGFNNREGGEGSLMSLAHDDLGAKNDYVDPNNKSSTVKVNQEIISLRGTVEGEYIINGHAYNKDREEPIVKVSCKLIKVKPFKEIIKVEREFKNNGDEITFFRFKIDKEGNIVDTNELPQKFVTLNKQADVEQ